MAREYTEIDIAPYIDHALLHPSTTPEQITQGCEQVDQMHFASICIAPAYVRQAADLLHGKSAKVCAVIGFPMGATTAQVKLYEAQEAVENGARELDVAINLGLLKAGKTEAVHREIAEICEATGVTVKAILETNLLTDAEKRIAAELCLEAGVEFLKTSTGWNGGATVADVRLLGELTKGQAGIKASGGIRTIEQAYELIWAGATRLGTSRGPDLLRQRDRLGKDTREPES